MKNLINSIKRKVYLIMGTAPYSEIVEKDQVALASANTYLTIASQQGLAVDVNTANSRTRTVGGSNPVYPDVILWKPSPGSTSGTAIAVEAIETPSTITQDIPRLQRLGSLGIPLTIIVPNNYKTVAKQIIDSNKVNYNRLQSYEYNPTNGSYNFYDVK